MNAIKFTIISLPLLLSGCSSLNIKEKTLRNSIIAGAIGYKIGEQKDTNKNANAALYSSLMALGAAGISLYYFDPDQEIEKQKNEVQSIRKKLDDFQNPKIISISPSFPTGKVPEKYRRMIQPGEWKVYDIDEWVDDGENRLIHQDKIMELTPPSLRPVSDSIKK
jgi:hypothetical protein